MVIASRPALQHMFSVRVGPTPVIDGSTNVTKGIPATFTMHSSSECAIRGVLDPQRKLKDVVATDHSATLTPADDVGLTTAFLQLQCGAAKWLHPLDLHVHEFHWDLATHVIPPFRQKGCSAARDPTMQGPSCWPAIRTPALRGNVLHISLANRGSTVVEGRATLTFAGLSLPQAAIPLDLHVAANTTSELNVDIPAGTFALLSPGTVRFTLKLGQDSRTAEAIAWSLNGTNHRQKTLNLSDSFSSSIGKLYSMDTVWRMDYSGSNVGVDRREPSMPELVPASANQTRAPGYVLETSPPCQWDWCMLDGKTPATRRLVRTRTWCRHCSEVGALRGCRALLPADIQRRHLHRQLVLLRQHRRAAHRSLR